MIGTWIFSKRKKKKKLGKVEEKWEGNIFLKLHKSVGSRGVARNKRFIFENDFFSNLFNTI